jgi:hypothetical protein
VAVEAVAVGLAGRVSALPRLLHLRLDGVRLDEVLKRLHRDPRAALRADREGFDLAVADRLLEHHAADAQHLGGFAYGHYSVGVHVGGSEQRVARCGNGKSASKTMS